MSVPRTRQFALLGVLSAAIAAKRSQRDVRLLGPASVEVIGDSASLEQAVGHLLQNAIEASRGDAAVQVRVSAAHGGRVAIEIADRGCGMDSDFVRNRLFQPFASTKAGGFGIGAFEARSLVHAMGGQLSVASKPDEGTCFTIHLPAAVIAQSAAAPTRKIA
jgi:signal transduction histidine kinase